MNEGKPYPRSSCADCGSLIAGSRMCAQDVEPNDPSQARFYVPTRKKEESVDKYAVVVKSSYSEAGYDRNDLPSTVYYETLKYFESEAALKKYLLENKETRYSPDTIIRVIKYQELKVKTEVVISLD